MFSKPKLFIVAAPSGAGKTTLCQQILKKHQNELCLSISCTTRQPRGTEKEGVHYYFLNTQEFEQKIKQNEFAEWAHVHGHYYGTLKKTILTAFENKKSVLLDIDVQGAEQLKNVFKDDAYRIFIVPPNMETLEKRLRERATDSEESIQRRLLNARKEIQASRLFEKIIVNDDFDKAFLEFNETIETELKRR